MTYRELLDWATAITPGDHSTAAAWLQEVGATLATEPLKPNERRYLYRMRGVWRDRAEGKDARWDRVGCRAGALSKEHNGTTDSEGPLAQHQSLPKVAENQCNDSSARLAPVVAPLAETTRPPERHVAPEPVKPAIPARSRLAEILGKY